MKVTFVNVNDVLSELKSSTDKWRYTTVMCCVITSHWTTMKLVIYYY